MRLITRLSVLSALLFAATVLACSSEPTVPESKAAAPQASAPAQTVAVPAASSAPAAPAAAPAAAAATAELKPGVPLPEVHALHNVFRIQDRLISGSGPEDEAAFVELQKLGVKTVISVDGAAPDVELAAKYGMRYVHVPVTYAEVTAAQQLQIAKSIRDLPGPVYVHCHHGKHRGPAALASAAVDLGLLTPVEGVAFLKQAGTAANYTGLYACVESAAPVPAATLDALVFDFPSQAKPDGLVAAMVEVDAAWEHLGEIKAAGWAVPKDHPDLVPAAEAGRLADNFRFGHESAEARELGADFLTKLGAVQEKAAALEQQISSGAPQETLEASYAALQSSCKSCHATYRDKVR